MYGRPNASLTTGLSAPPISSEPLPAPMWRPVSHVKSPSRISFPINFSSVFAVCELIAVFVLSFDADLFVISHDGFKQIAKSLVAAIIVSAGDLQEQLLQRVKAAQLMACNCVREPCPEHYKFVLLLGVRRSDRTSHRTVKSSQLTPGA